MKAVVRYQSNDGEMFANEIDARSRDRLIEDVDAAMQHLGPKWIDEGCRFANGHGYIQHTKESVEACKLAVHEIAKGPLGWWFDSQINDHGKTHESLALETHPSWPGILLDGGCKPLEVAYRRLMCIDSRFREWGQPYYAAHPETATHVQLR